MIQYNSDDGQIRHIPIIQDDDVPQVQELLGIKEHLVLQWIEVLSLIYRFPAPQYALLEKSNAVIFNNIWYFQILLFEIKEQGVIYSGKKMYELVKRKITSGLDL